MGRDPSCDIVIRNTRCSRRHASLRVVPQGFHLLDLGSSNGVYVLGQKVEDAIIREGDVFSMGDVFVRILPEDMPATLAMPKKRDAAAPRGTPPKTPVRAEASLLAPRVLAASSIGVGAALLGGPWYLWPKPDPLILVPCVVGAFTVLAGLGVLARARWAKGLHYALFTIWVLSCLLAPLGIIGFAYQSRGEGRPETDSFFAVVVGIAGFLAVIALMVAAFLARLYVPAPLPV